MNKLEQAARQALEALKWYVEEDDVMEAMPGNEPWVEGKRNAEKAITALRKALEQPAQSVEPVLVVELEPSYMSRGHFYKGDKPHIDPTKVWKLPIGTKLYTAPQPAAVEQEPVAWMFQHEEAGLIMCVDVQQVESGFEKNNPRWQKVCPLYKAPQSARQPLTDEQIASACLSYRHDFGLLSKKERESLIFQAREWERALAKERGIGGES